MPPPADSLSRPDYNRNDDRMDNRLPKMSKPEPLEASQGFRPSTDIPVGSQPMYVSNQGGMLPMSAVANRIPPIRDPSGDVPSSAPLPPRSMAMHELTQPEPHGPPQRRSEDVNRDESQQGDRGRNEPPSTKSPIPERLPAMGSLSAPLSASARDSREDARLLTSVAAPPLSIPATNPSLSRDSEGQKPSTSPVAAPGESASSGLGTNAPVLPPMPARPLPSSLGAIIQDNKEGSSSLGPSGVGVSSLTKFGKGLARTPATPVNSSVAPSSLPSPLPTRKVPVGPSMVRSPRIANPSGGPTFKPVSIPSISAPQVGHIESVPSPSSLPVLPALPSHPNNSGIDKPASQEIAKDQDIGKEDVDSDARAGRPKPDEKGAKDNAVARKPDESAMNKPRFGILRSALAPVPTTDRDRSEKNDKVKSPTDAAPRMESESGNALKRDGSNDDSGRTAKRPRLHDINEPAEQKPFSSFSADEGKKTPGNKAESERMEEDSVKGGTQGPGKSEIPSFKELKGATGASQSADAEKSGKRDGPGRNIDVDGGNLSRLSAPLSRSGPPPLPGTIPSFRSERKKSTSQDNTTSRPFALRSTPLPSLATAMKSHVTVPSSSRGGVDRNYGSSQAEESVGKRVSEDKAESGAGGNSSRDEVMRDRGTNGETQKSSGGSGESEARTAGTAEMSPKEEKQSGRTEIPSSAT